MKKITSLGYGYSANWALKHSRQLLKEDSAWGGKMICMIKEEQKEDAGVSIFSGIC